MVRYTKQPDNPTKSCKAKGSNLRVSFKVNQLKLFKLQWFNLKITITNILKFLENWIYLIIIDSSKLLLNKLAIKMYFQALL